MVLRRLNAVARGLGVHEIVADPLPEHRGYLRRLGFQRLTSHFHLDVQA